jgi:hypothetical protein
VFIHCPGGLAAMAKYEMFGWGFSTVPQPGLGGRRGYQPRGKVLGGSSSINAMVYICAAVTLEDGVMISASTTFTNDKFNVFKLVINKNIGYCSNRILYINDSIYVLN